MILVAFATTTMSMSATTLLGCNASFEDLPFGARLLAETLAFLSSSLELKDEPILEALLRHPKDLFAPWNTTKKLSQQYQDLVTSSDLGTLPIATSLTIFSNHHQRTLLLWSSLQELVLV